MNQLKNSLSEDGLVQEISEILENNPKISEDDCLATTLTQAGFLPLYGLPSSSRSLILDIFNQEMGIKLIDQMNWQLWSFPLTPIIEETEKCILQLQSLI